MANVAAASSGQSAKVRLDKARLNLSIMGNPSYCFCRSRGFNR
jgi:hypothetical protein